MARTTGQLGHAQTPHLGSEPPDRPLAAVEAGRAWAERRALGMRRFGLSTVGAVWAGTVIEAEWLFRDEPPDRRYCLAVVALEAAALRWREIVARRAA